MPEKYPVSERHRRAAGLRKITRLKLSWNLTTDSVDDGISSATAMDSAQPPADTPISAAVNAKRKLPKTSKSYEITSLTIRTPAFSYACLEVVSDPPSDLPLDDLTVRSYLISAFTQFLGLTGSAISVDILKVEPKECWIRVPREDLSAVIAAVGGWVGHGENGREVGWRVRESGNWLGSLAGARSAAKLWAGLTTSTTS